MSKIRKSLKIFSVILFLCLTVSPVFALSTLEELENAGSAERVRLGILRFYSKTYGIPDAMADGISDFFTRMLFKSDGIMLVERERLNDVVSELRLGMSGLVDERTAAQVGKLAGCEYVLFGAITNLGHGASGAYIPGFGVPFFGGVDVSTQKVKADLDVRVVKVETGEIVFADSASGEASKSDTGLSVYGFGIHNSEFGGLEANAILAATAKLAPSIEKSLTGKDTLTAKLQAETKKGKKGAKDSVKKSKELKEAKKSSRKKSKNAEPESEAEVPAAPSETPESPSEVSSAGVQPDKTETSTASSSEKTLENKSTDPSKVIPTYGLESGKANMLRLKHINLAKSKQTKHAYEEYVKLYEDFNGDYLAAYKAGEFAQKLKDYETAGLWYDKALEINPEYEPAQKAKKALSKIPAKKRKK